MLSFASNVYAPHLDDINALPRRLLAPVALTNMAKPSRLTRTSNRIIDSRNDKNAKQVFGLNGHHFTTATPNWFGRPT
ncbi:MAG: hypothetical protein U1A73_09075 [Pseudomonas sp.]|nr:hypothetical protein [Pseudomonas sp.]